MGGLVHVLAASSELQVAMNRVGDSWAWYVIRAAGFMAAALLILLMISGIGMVTGLTYKVFPPIKAWVIHKTLGIAMLVAIGVHIVALLFDKYVNFSITQILVPFASSYSNNVKLLGLSFKLFAVALGIFAMYGSVIVVASSLGWIETKKQAWKLLHYLSYFVMFAVFVHALTTGTDLKRGIFRMIWIGLTCLVALAILSRLRRVGSLKNVDPEV